MSEEWPEGRVTPKEALENMTQKDWEIVGLKATVAQQAQMIEHLRGGPTPGYTAVDMTTAAAQGFRDGVASLLPVLEMARGYVHIEGSDEEADTLDSAIIAAGGRIKE